MGVKVKFDTCGNCEFTFRYFILCTAKYKLNVNRKHLSVSSIFNPIKSLFLLPKTGLYTKAFKLHELFVGEKKKRIFKQGHENQCQTSSSYMNVAIVCIRFYFERETKIKVIPVVSLPLFTLAYSCKSFTIKRCLQFVRSCEKPPCK